MIKTWTSGSYKQDGVIKALRNLDKVSTVTGSRDVYIDEEDEYEDDNKDKDEDEDDNKDKDE